MNARSLYFTGEESVEVRSEPVPQVTPETVLVEIAYSAISAGTEGLVYRGDVPRPLESTGTVETLSEDFDYPIPYGYAAVGRVVDVGEKVAESWPESQPVSGPGSETASSVASETAREEESTEGMETVAESPSLLGERVFVYAPHQSHVLATPDELVRVPESIPTELAPLFANAETATSLVLDAHPAIGERVAVFGQGMVGLLVTGMLAELPLDALVAVEPLEARREFARRMGADHVLDPDDTDLESALVETVGSRADRCVEVSGNPAALEAAIEATRFDGTVVVGSWYGTKPAELPLGGRFHRHRIDVRSSQVSTIAPRHRGRWTRERRRAVAWDRLEALDIEDLLTHRIPIEDAQRAYSHLETRPEEVAQVLLTYDSQ